MNVNKSTGRITGLHSSVSASFRFTRQSIQCIGQAGLRRRLASKPAGEQTSQNICFAPEKTRSASEDIAGIEKTANISGLPLLPLLSPIYPKGVDYPPTTPVGVVGR